MQPSQASNNSSEYQERPLEYQSKKKTAESGGLESTKHNVLEVGSRSRKAIHKSPRSRLLEITRCQTFKKEKM